METLENTQMSMEEAAALFAPLEMKEAPKAGENALATTASGVYAEPIITAQPCQVIRNIPAFLQKIKALAQMAGEDYCYRWPVKDKGGQKKFVEGPTITLANDLAREYMNCMVDVRAVDQGDNTIFYARFIDYETGFCMTRAFRQRKNQKTMNTDTERAADIVFQIGQSKAIRNVVVNALQTYADFAFREARGSLVAQIGEKLEDWRAKMKAGIAQKRYDLKRIEASVGNPIDKWLAPDIARVIAELKSIADGMASFDDLYPDPNDPDSAVSKTEAIKEKLKSAREATPAHEPKTGEVHAKAATPIAASTPAQEAPIGFDPAAYALDTPDGVTNATRGLLAALEGISRDERAGQFVAWGGVTITERLKEDGNSLELAKFKKLGIHV